VALVCRLNQALSPVALPWPARVALGVGIGALLLVVVNQWQAPEINPSLERASVLAGALADRIGRGPTLVVVMASLGTSMGLWLLARDYAAFAVFALWMGVSYGGSVSLMPALCMDFFGARAVSSVIGTLYTGAALGNLAGPWAAGRLFDATGSYAAAVVGVGLLALASAAAAWQAIRQR